MSYNFYICKLISAALIFVANILFSSYLFVFNYSLAFLIYAFTFKILHTYLISIVHTSIKLAYSLCKNVFAGFLTHKLLCYSHVVFKPTHARCLSIAAMVSPHSTVDTHITGHHVPTMTGDPLLLPQGLSLSALFCTSHMSHWDNRNIQVCEYKIPPYFDSIFMQVTRILNLSASSRPQSSLLHPSILGPVVTYI